MWQEGQVDDGKTSKGDQRQSVSLASEGSVAALPSHSNSYKEHRLSWSLGSRLSEEGLSFSGKTPIRNSIGSSRRPTFGITPSRGSASEVSLSDPTKAEEPDGPITLADIALSDLDIINDPKAGYEEKEESRERLNLIFSNTKDTPYYESLRKKFTEEQSAVTRELRLAALIKHITKNVIVQKQLWLENQWQEYVITVVEKIIDHVSPYYNASGDATCLEQINQALSAASNNQELYSFLKEKNEKIKLMGLLSSKTTKQLKEIVEEVKKLRIAVKTRVYNIKVNFFDELIKTASSKALEESDQNNVYGILDVVVQSEVKKYAQSLLSATVKLISDDDVQRNLQYDLISYLSLLIKRDKLVENLSDNKTIEELETIKHQCIAIEVEDNSVFLVSVEDYISIQKRETIEHHHQQLVKNVASLSDDQKKAACDSARELETYLDSNPQLQNIAALSECSIEELCRHHRLLERTEIRIEDEQIKFTIKILECLDSIGGNIQAFEQQPVVKENKADQALIMRVLAQSMDVLYEDNSKQNALDKSILSKDFSLIIKVLTYAKDNTCLDRLLSLTLKKIKERNEKASFLLLIACTWLFDSQAGGDNLFNPSYVNKIRQKQHENFSTLFNQLNEPALNSTELVEIARQLFDASNNLDHKSISMPAVVWQALKEKQLPHERFEKLAHFYKKAIIHVTEKYNDDPELYETKRNLLLNTLYRYAKTEYPLEEAVVYIANALVASNSTLALLKPACFSGLFTLNKTQRLIWQARELLPKEGSCPSLQLSSVGCLSTNKQIQAVLAKLQGTDQQQEERQKECVCKDLMEKKQSWLPSFWPRSTESSIDMYDHPIHRPDSNEV